jgi:S-formylglutathione hydrolase FrmB
MVAPSQVPWGQKALTGYLGANPQGWRAHDAVALIEDGARLPDLLVDQGGATLSSPNSSARSCWPTPAALPASP